MSYVDVFLIPVPKSRLADYEKMSGQFAALWKKWGASDYVEYQGDDVPMGEVTSFPRAVQAKDDEGCCSSAGPPIRPRRCATPSTKKMRSDPSMAGTWKCPSTASG